MLADGDIVMQNKATLHTVMISQNFFTGATIDVLWPAKSPDINTNEHDGQSYDDASIIWIDYLEMQLSFVQRAQ